MSERPEIVFVAGLSGSGKSTAMAALEDSGYYGVDNLPPQLVAQFLDLCSKAKPPVRRIALAVAAREERFLRSLPSVLEELRNQGARVRILFLDCSNEVLEKRYRETRRVHPLSPGGSVEEGIERERSLLAEVAQLADVYIDTSSMNVHQLRDAVSKLGGGGAHGLVVNLVSFGFRHGAPQSVDLLFDIRFLPNPYFDERLRPQSGREAEVADFVLRNPEGEELFQRLLDFVGYLVPRYEREGKAYLTVGIGCTGGRHRSVAVAAALCEALRERGREVNLEHRDVDR